MIAPSAAEVGSNAQVKYQYAEGQKSERVRYPTNTRNCNTCPCKNQQAV